MYGLLLRLAALDADAASAVRVIGFFDALVEQSASIDVVLKHTAALAGCAVGVRRRDAPTGQRADVNTPVHDGAPPVWALVRPVPAGHEVWIERFGTPLPLDELVLERFALVTSVAISRRRRDVEEMDGADLLRLAVDAAAEEVGRRRALARLGLVPTSIVHVIAADGPPDLVEVLAGTVGPLVAHAPIIGTAHALVGFHPFSQDADVPTGTRLGIASAHPALELPTAWREASIALRFARPSGRDGAPCVLDEPVAVRYRALGGFGALVERMPPEAINEVEDVQALDKLATDPGGEELLRTLEVVASTESMRRAAAKLHIHHNSVAHRVSRAEKVLGFSLAGPCARSRLTLALVLRQLRDSADLA